MFSPRIIRWNHAFSLLELLIAVAIIAVMMLLGVSLMGRMRAQGDAARCVSNLRQSGVALLRSAGENSGILQFHRYNQYGSPTTIRWNDFLIRGGYLGAKDAVTSCPGVRRDLPTGGGYVYGGIGEITADDPHSTKIEGMAASRAIRLLTIERPARYWLLGDTWSIQHNNQIYIVGTTASTQWRIQMRHGKRANLLFADGHVEAMGLASTKELPIHPIVRAYDADAKPIQ